MEVKQVKVLLFYYVINRKWTTSKTSRHNPVFNNDRSEDISMLSKTADGCIVPTTRQH